MDDPKIIHDIYEIAKVAATRQIQLSHLVD
jgi:hypothetical protein